jgi:hypothetical protein
MSIGIWYRTLHLPVDYRISRGWKDYLLRDFGPWMHVREATLQMGSREGGRAPRMKRLGE